MSVSERVLPHNLEAEKAVLGAILIDNEAFDVVTEVAGREVFYRDAHRRIFDSMLDLMDRRVRIDLVTLKEDLDRRGELEEVGGVGYVSALIDGVPRSTNVAYYAKILKEKATLRALIFSANKVLSDAYAAEQDASDIL
jgi:replicative DNA helicase